MSPLYWELHPDGPFATLIAVATSYLHPEIDDVDSLKRFAKSEDSQETRVFKSELREALRLFPGYSGAHFNLGQALSSLGRFAEADAEFAAARSSASH